ncbi:EAL domain-containing protein [Acidocella sp.]|jgi:EAL domain-containing protein (putative c-di-GMP-specific phosphodiesterase class I)|uniref:EAL domain-containing protein n=1 Tax=Acidocella sp. TaxID=50710 RepID=UPI002F422306
MPAQPPFPRIISPAPDLHEVPRSTWHEVTERRRVTRRLRHALAAGDLLLHYQPLVTLGSGQIRGAEALVRLRHHRLGLLPASHFMPGVERADIIVEFGGWLLDQACAQAAIWPEPACIAVTLAPRHLQDRNFMRQFLERLGRTGIAPERLELGLTEAMLTGATTNTAFSLNALQGLGVRLALTIFGGGSINLPALRRLQLTTLRLDRSLTHNLDGNPDSDAIVRAIKTGHELGCTVLADGVDTKRQFSRLLKMGCDEGQGNYFSPPLAASELVAWFTPR